MTAKNGRQSASARAETAPDKNGFSLISDEKLIELYAAMVKSRMLAKHAAALKKRGVVAGDLNASVGREAAVAGVAVDLLPEDTLSPSQWDFVSSFIKGMTLDGMFSHLGAGNEHSNWPAKLRFDPKANVIVPAPNLGARLDMACGVALVHRTAKNGKIVVVTCGDAADTVESWRDPIRFAGFHELPMVFVWHNDGEDEREIRMPQGRSGDSPSKTADRNVPAIIVDGRDAVAVYRVASEAIQRARSGRGPTLIECKGAENGLNGSIRGEHDPIVRMEAYLTRKGLFSAAEKRKITAAFNRDLDAATRFLTR